MPCYTYIDMFIGKYYKKSAERPIGGPAFAGIVSAKSGSETVYFIIGCLMIFACVLTALLKSIERQKDVVRGNNKGKIQELFKNKGLLFAFLGALSLSASQGILAYMLPLKVDGLELANHISGMLMSIFGIVAILFFYAADQSGV
ncbi:MFS transporter [Caldifermentibacillus hisashii]|uniref:MFS transporter n=1 Tax=Caldifermentibacillus hisashii TaxID=996558 RepID=UPI0031B7B291